MFSCYTSDTLDQHSASKWQQHLELGWSLLALTCRRLWRGQSRDVQTSTCSGVKPNHAHLVILMLKIKSKLSGFSPESVCVEPAASPDCRDCAGLSLAAGGSKCRDNYGVKHWTRAQGDSETLPAWSTWSLVMITVCLLLPDISSQPEVQVCAMYPGLWDSSLRSPSRLVEFYDQLFLEIQDYFLITDICTNSLSQVGKGTSYLVPPKSCVLNCTTLISFWIIYFSESHIALNFCLKLEP